MKTFLEVEENWKDRIEDPITFPAQDYLLNLQEKMNRLKEIRILISEDTLFSSGGSRGIVGIGKGFFVI